MRAQSNLAVPKPTFVDGPSTFLSSLSAKPKSRAESQLKGNSAAEIQRVKTELSNQIQTLANKQDLSGRQLDTRLNQLQQELRPKVGNLDNQQSNTQKQLEDTRQRIQKISTEDISPLQNQFDQIGVKFERFIRYEIESKIKPMHGDLRLSGTKADELIATVNSSVKRLSDSSLNLQDKINKISLDIQTQQNQNASSIEDLYPKVSTLEQQLRQIKDLLEDSPENETVSQEIVEKSIQKVQSSIDRIETEVLPKNIEETNAHFIDAIKQLGEYCETEISKLQESLTGINGSCQKIEDQRKETEGSLDNLTKSSFEIQNKISKLDQNIRSHILTLEQSVNSTLSFLQSKITDFQTEGDAGSSKIKDQAADDIAVLRSQITKTINDMKDGIKSKTTNNQLSQQEAMNKICQLKSQIEENLFERLQKVEENTVNCINTINEVNSKRSDRYSKVGSKSDLIKRIEEVENRIALAEQRMSKLDNKIAIEVKIIRQKVEIIPPVPPEFNESEETSQTTKTKSVKVEPKDVEKEEEEDKNEKGKQKEEVEIEEEEEDKSENDDSQIEKNKKDKEEEDKSESDDDSTKSKKKKDKDDNKKVKSKKDKDDEEEEDEEEEDKDGNKKSKKKKDKDEEEEDNDGNKKSKKKKDKDEEEEDNDGSKKAKKKKDKDEDEEEDDDDNKKSKKKKDKDEEEEEDKSESDDDDAKSKKKKDKDDGKKVKSKKDKDDEEEEEDDEEDKDDNKKSKKKKDKDDEEEDNDGSEKAKKKKDKDEKNKSKNDKDKDDDEEEDSDDGSDDDRPAEKLLSERAGLFGGK